MPLTRIHLHRIRSWGAVAVATAAFTALSAAAPAAGVETESSVVVMTPELKEEIKNHIDTFMTGHAVPGMSVAVVTPDPDDPTGPRPITTTFTVGTPIIGSLERVDSTTQFEIGSETKVFTAGLLAHLVAIGRVHLDDPVKDYAPSWADVPGWFDPVSGGYVPITLGDLATHQSGLPELPPGMRGCDVDAECEHYTQDMLWSDLAPGELLWEPGTNWLYSDWGFGLLGTVLAGVIDPTMPFDEPPTYEPALKHTFLDALGMSSTRLGTGPRIAHPYSSQNEHTVYWNNTNALAGGGGLVSDADDMASFLAAHLGYIAADAPPGVRSLATTLVPASTITVTCSTPDTCVDETFRMGLGWRLYSADSDQMGEPLGVDWAFKNGSTAGFRSDTALAVTERVGVTTMWNQRNDAEPGVDLLRLILEEHSPKPSPDHDHGRDEHRDHAEADRARLADTGLPAPAVSGAAPVAALLLVAAGIVLLRRRSGRSARSRPR